MTTIKKNTLNSALRVRSDLVPASCKYMTFDTIEYLLIPVSEFDAWYEAVENKAIADYAGTDGVDNGNHLLKTRKKRVPESGMKVFADRTWYVAVPVDDVQEWFEDIEDYAVIIYLREKPQPLLSWEEIQNTMATRRGAKTK
ncbi:MAG: hypothetical protein LIQ31_09745 [Planctomycetes bacterium]|nr:hypothetical protein [Planctomycetota bacterium]